MNGLDLFSGIGGLTYALSEYIRTIAYCEIDPFCQAVLLSRMADGSIQCAPIWDNIKTLSGEVIFGEIDIIFGGFPCQDISVAGLGKGLEGQRSGLFFEIIRLAKEIKPSFLFLENVPAVCTRGGLRVVREIAEMGYDCRWCIISAASVGALHKRDRWFLLAYSNSKGLEKQWNGEVSSEEEYTRSSDRSKTSRSENFWKIESRMDKLVDGVSHRVAKIRAIGNAVVPQQAEKAFEILMGIK